MTGGYLFKFYVPITSPMITSINDAHSDEKNQIDRYAGHEIPKDNAATTR